MFEIREGADLSVGSETGFVVLPKLVREAGLGLVMVSGALDGLGVGVGLMCTNSSQFTALSTTCFENGSQSFLSYFLPTSRSFSMRERSAAGLRSLQMLPTASLGFDFVRSPKFLLRRRVW